MGLPDRYFTVPLQITRRKLDGVKDSLVASSVWRQDFKQSLASFPEFELVQLDFTVPGCDACHLGSRISTLQGRLSGDPYDRTTLQVMLLLVPRALHRTHLSLATRRSRYGQ